MFAEARVPNEGLQKTTHQLSFQPLDILNYGMGSGLMECLMDFNELPSSTLHQHVLQTDMRVNIRVCSHERAPC